LAERKIDKNWSILSNIKSKEIEVFFSASPLTGAITLTNNYTVYKRSQRNEHQVVIQQKTRTKKSTKN